MQLTARDPRMVTPNSTPCNYGRAVVTAVLNGGRTHRGFLDPTEFELGLGGVLVGTGAERATYARHSGCGNLALLDGVLGIVEVETVEAHGVACCSATLAERTAR